LDDATRFANRFTTPERQKMKQSHEMKPSHVLVLAALLLGATCLALAQSNGTEGTATSHGQSSITQIATATVAAGKQSDGLPEGKGKAALLRACVGCHEIELATGMRHTETGWQRMVDTMVGRGAELSEPEIVDVTAYLAKYFGQVNVNTAAAAQLEEALGLTEKEAQAIVSYREQNGDIKGLDQLKSVPGVSPDKIQAKTAVIAFRD
jgi:competence protein ComEA